MSRISSRKLNCSPSFSTFPHFHNHVFTDYFKLKMHCFHLWHRENSTYKTVIISFGYFFPGPILHAHESYCARHFSGNLTEYSTIFKIRFYCLNSLFRFILMKHETACDIISRSITTDKQRSFFSELMSRQTKIIFINCRAYIIYFTVFQ